MHFAFGRVRRKIALLRTGLTLILKVMPKKPNYLNYICRNGLKGLSRVDRGICYVLSLLFMQTRLSRPPREC